MKNIKIGVQMMMLKDKVAELGIYEVMRKVGELGYHSVEISQIPMTQENVDNLAKASKDFGIDVGACSASLEPMMPGAPGETLKTHFDKIVEDCKKLNCRYLRVGMIPLNLIGSKENYINFAKKMDDMAVRLSEQGIQLYYHNHHVEFQKFDGEYALDIMKNNSKNFGFELDVHWIHRGGLNPVNVIKNYKGRVDILHLKDYRIGAMDLSFLKNGDWSKFSEAFNNVVEFAELGEGNLDFKSIIETGIEAGVQYFFIEQDNTYGRDPFESLRISRDHLIKLGYEQYL